MLAALSLALLGCATSEKYEAQLATWVGHPSGELIANWGAPSSTFKTPDGTQVYEYLKTGATNGYANRNQFTGGVNATSYTNYCKTTFVLNGADVITNWRWEGNMCRAN